MKRGKAAKKQGLGPETAVPGWVDIIRDNDDASVLAIVEAHQKEPIRVSSSRSPLCAAACLGRDALVERLIQLGHKPQDAESPLSAALQAPNNMLRVIELLLRMPYYSWDRETISASQLTDTIFPRGPSLALLRLMKSTLTNHHQLFTAHTYPALDTPMLVAARINNAAIVEYLLAEGVRPVSNSNNGTLSQSLFECGAVDLLCLCGA